MPSNNCIDNQLLITSNVHNNKAQKLITYNSKNCKSFQAEVQIKKYVIILPVLQFCEAIRQDCIILNFHFIKFETDTCQLISSNVCVDKLIRHQ